MSESCEEMERLREKSESSCRFQRARVMVERMLQERLSLKGMHRNGRASSSHHCCGSRQTGDLQGLTGKNGALVRPEPVEGANEFLQLLKSHKETLEEEMRELRRKKEEFEREKDEGEKDRAWMRQCIDQLLVQAKRGDQHSRLEVAERTLAVKQDQIDQLKNELELQKSSLETVSVLSAQVEIYKADFLAEREARTKLNQKKDELQDRLNQALAEIDRLKQEATSRSRTEQMIQRHLKGFPTWAPHFPPQQGAFSSAVFNTVSRVPLFCNQSLAPVSDVGATRTEELSDLCCPK